jgi:diadenylate cyclase
MEEDFEEEKMEEPVSQTTEEQISNKIEELVSKKVEEFVLKQAEEPAQKKAEQEKKKDFLEVLKLFSPGTSLRSALDDILRARMGALIAVENEKLSEIVEGGFKVNSKFSAQKVVELAKMDGAIILSNDLKKILYANTVLFPNIQIPTKETGTRHKAAERTARHTGAIVIAVSERKNKITVYYGEIRHELKVSSEVLRRAAESLQILEKHKEIFNDSISNLNLLEINNLVVVGDVCEVLQRIEIIQRISDKIKKYLVELGKEGIIVSMRLQELTKNLNREKDLILKDYFKLRISKAETILSNLSFDLLIDTVNISKILFENSSDKTLFPKGIRFLSKTSLSAKDVDLFAKSFKNLSEIFDAESTSIIEILKDEKAVNLFKKELGSLREKVLVGKKI